MQFLTFTGNIQEQLENDIKHREGIVKQLQLIKGMMNVLTQTGQLAGMSVNNTKK